MGLRGWWGQHHYYYSCGAHCAPPTASAPAAYCLPVPPPLAAATVATTCVRHRNSTPLVCLAPAKPVWSNFLGLRHLQPAPEQHFLRSSPHFQHSSHSGFRFCRTHIIMLHMLRALCSFRIHSVCDSLTNLEFKLCLAVLEGARHPKKKMKMKTGDRGIEIDEPTLPEPSSYRGVNRCLPLLLTSVLENPYNYEPYVPHRKTLTFPRGIRLKKSQKAVCVKYYQVCAPIVAFPTRIKSQSLHSSVSDSVPVPGTEPLSYRQVGKPKINFKMKLKLLFLWFYSLFIFIFFYHSRREVSCLHLS